MPDIDLDAIRRAVTEYAAVKAKATERPWTPCVESDRGYRGNDFGRFYWPSYVEAPFAGGCMDPQSLIFKQAHADARFIAAARNTPIEEWVVQLLGEVEQMHKDNARLLAAVEAERQNRFDSANEWRQENKRLRGLCREAAQAVDECWPNYAGLVRQLKAACGE